MRLNSSGGWPVQQMHVSSNSPMPLRDLCSGPPRSRAMAKHIDKGEFDFLIVAEGNQIGDDLTLAGRRTGYSSIKETIEFFRGRGIKIYEAV
jgi:hypothetical protein